jgi:hypothetical protein
LRRYDNQSNYSDPAPAPDPVFYHVLPTDHLSVVKKASQPRFRPVSHINIINNTIDLIADIMLMPNFHGHSSLKLNKILNCQMEFQLFIFADINQMETPEDKFSAGAFRKYFFLGLLLERLWA